jgi:hypothetical protein
MGGFFFSSGCFSSAGLVDSQRSCLSETGNAGPGTSQFKPHLTHLLVLLAYGSRIATKGSSLSRKGGFLWHETPVQGGDDSSNLPVSKKIQGMTLGDT